MQEYVLDTWSAAASQPSAVADTLAMGANAALTLSPAESGVGGSLYASNIAVRADSGITAADPCALIVSGISWAAAKTLALAGRVIARDGVVRVRCDRRAFAKGGRYTLLDASGASGLEKATFELDADEDAVFAARTRLNWNGEVLTLAVRCGFVLTVR